MEFQKSVSCLCAGVFSWKPFVSSIVVQLYLLLNPLQCSFLGTYCVLSSVVDTKEKVDSSLTLRDLTEIFATSSCVRL
jgi:hypothetical protein